MFHCTFIYIHIINYFKLISEVNPTFPKGLFSIL